MAIDVQIDPVTGRVEMQFLTCSATLPTGKKGLSFLSPSCGSGKSTAIAKLAVKASGGVLIVVPTISDGIQMRRRIVSEEGGSYDDICVLHSQDFAVIDTYRNDPLAFTDIPVLVLTSARLQIDPIQPFMTFRGGSRDMVLIDELINFYPDPFEIPAELQDVVTYIDSHKSHSGKPAIEDVLIDGKTYYRHIYSRVEEMVAAVQMAKKRLKNDILNGKGGLNSYKRKTILEHIRDHGFSPIQKKVVDLAADATVILFDGTADIIVPRTDPRLVPISGTRYNSDIEFGRFEFRMKRRHADHWGEADFKRMAPEFIKLAVDLSQGEKILIICWKTLKLETRNTGNADTLENTASIGFPEILQRVLLDAGGKEENIHITYRGSGHDRGSNEYRECSVVIFLGEWRLPEEPITTQISQMFGFQMSFRSYKLSLLVQTISRTRIREHKGLPVKVLFSSDIDYELAWETQEYFKANSPSACKIGGLLKPSRKRSRPEKRFLYYLCRLYSYDPRIRTAVESGTTYNFTISLSILYGLVPISPRKASDRYKTFIKFLSGLQITMTIDGKS